MKFPVLTILLLFSLNLLACQENQKLPEAVAKTFQKMYPDEHDPDFKLDAHGYWEAHFKKDGEKYRADFYDNGKWRETENSIKKKNLPEVVKKIIKDKYDYDQITEVEHVLSAKYGEFYDVEFKRKGKNRDIMFKKDGTIIPE